MDKKFYQELNDLVDIHNNCTSDGEEIFCFNLIKEIVEGKVLKENIDREKKMIALKQLTDSLEWLQGIGVQIEYSEDYMKFFNW